MVNKGLKVVYDASANSIGTHCWHCWHCEGIVDNIPGQESDVLHLLWVNDISLEQPDEIHSSGWGVLKPFST